MTTSGNMCARKKQTIAKRSGSVASSARAPFCPDPVWKPARAARMPGATRYCRAPIARKHVFSISTIIITTSAITIDWYG